jgi:hypothetical protein
MDNYLAVGIAEGFEEAESEDQVLEAWQHLVDTGMAWSLQGWFGRQALALISQEVISPPKGFEYNPNTGKLAKIEE